MQNKSQDQSEPSATVSQANEKLNKKKAPPKKGMKRVVKERMFNDENGYMVVEEYSEYEEMTPEEIAKQKAPKVQNQKQAVLTPPPASTAKPAAATGPAGKMKQGGLMNFFGKK